MFANQRRGTAGLGSITGVALVALIWLLGASVMLKTYREGGSPSPQQVPSSCQVVCQAGVTDLKKG